MSEAGKVPALIDGQTHHGFMWNAKEMVYFTNGSGASRTSGEVVIRNTAASESFTTTPSANDIKVLGVVAQIDDVNGVAQAQTIANAAKGYIQHSGYIAVVNMDATTVRGDFLFASATAGKASPGATYANGAFGVAVTPCTGAGTVAAILFPVQRVDHAGIATIGTNTHVQIDTHIAANKQVHGLPANVYTLGDSDAAGEWMQRGSVATSGGSATVTFPKAYSTAVSSLVVTCVTAGGVVTTASLDSVSKAGFTVRSSADTTVYWMAIGV